ncbi:MAG: hypothetical protein HYV36_02720, partial [Lentisphaerae bacterium]|nr:hypothetical protein [Lentisphaerota bacterium]
MTGLACCSRVKNGPYTLARLGKAADGGYLMTCMEGAATDPSMWCEDCLGEPQHPSVLFKPDDLSVTEYLRSALAQHVAVVPGRWAEAL